MFTGAPAIKAAEQSRQYFDQTRTGNNTAIDTGLGTSLANIGQGYGSGRGALGTGYADATGAVNSGYGDALGYYGNARGEYGDLAGLGTKYGQGTNLYLDSLGVNGAEGNTRASSAFMPSQAYNFNLDQGLESINRARNARGMANSGNTDRDAQTFGAGLASNEMKGWQDRLAGLINPELAATSGAASGRANTDIGMANLASGRGTMLAGLASNYGSNLNNSYAGEGTSLAGLNTGAANAHVGAANALAQPYASTYKQEADAKLAGSANIMKAGMAAAQLAMGMPPTSLGSIGSNPSSQGVSNASGGGMFGGSDLSQAQMGGGYGGAGFNSYGQPLYGGGSQGLSLSNMFGGW